MMERVCMYCGSIVLPLDSENALGCCGCGRLYREHAHAWSVKDDASQVQWNAVPADKAPRHEWISRPLPPRVSKRALVVGALVLTFLVVSAFRT